MLRQYELVERVKSYDPHADEEALNRAYVFAMKMHASQKRESGEPFFSHPIEVAGILTEFKLDSATIIAALLHDTVEDTPADYADIKMLFGKDVADLVEGVTKLSKLTAKAQRPDFSSQAENFRKFVLAMSKDIRVLLIKLADRLHNMRTLHFRKLEEKRRKVALETLEIYVPLAERIGMYTVQHEMADLAFQSLYPQAYESLQARLKYLSEEGKDLIPKTVAQLQEDLKKHKVQAKVIGRQKTPYSIWKKMTDKGLAFEQIYDIIAFRIIVDKVSDCYKALGVLHTQYQMIPGKFKDYISSPKENGYQSIHTWILGPFSQRIQVQIRTQKMDETAEWGLAAHWEYKQGSHTDGTQYRWIRDLLDLMYTSADAKEFLEHTKMSMHHDMVFCFTPHGKLITLPRGATPLDFAYEVHTDLGNKCIGVKINEQIKPLRTTLQNGDQVEILIDKNQSPSPEWEELVITPKAKAQIRRMLKIKDKEKLTQKGKNAILELCKEKNKKPEEEDFKKILSTFKYESVSDLFCAVGADILKAEDVFFQLYPQYKKRRFGFFSRKINESKIIRGEIKGRQVSFASCCHPVPGDKIVGILMGDKSVIVHQQECEILDKFVQEPKRFIPLDWDLDKISPVVLPARLNLMVPDKSSDVFNLILNKVAKSKATILQLMVLGREKNKCVVQLDVEVKNKEHLDQLMASLKKEKDVYSVSRKK